MNNFIKRTAQKTLKELMKSYPVVTVVGPRQSGKTTLTKLTYPKLPYVNLEDLRHREFALNDPIAFLEKYQDGAIFDEIQRVPDLSSQIQVLVDKNNKKGRFILTGSHQFSVIEKISQSLAGRTSILKLLPLSLSEIRKNLILNNSAPILPSSDELIFKGFYPQLYSGKLNPIHYYQDYISTYLERDLRQMSEVRNLDTFRRFIKLCAGRVGQILDLTSLGEAAGVSQPTAREWLNLLEASFIVFKLPPFHSNISKRLVKRPKLYFYDAGLAAFLLDISDISQIPTHPLRGNLFENIVIADALKQRFNKHHPISSYFYRDQRGLEIDLLLMGSGKPLPVEIKSGKTINDSYFKNILAFKKLKLQLADNPALLVYDGSEAQKRSAANVIPLFEFAEVLD